MQQSSNPALSSKAFGRFASTDANDKMTVGGTLRKMGYAFAVLLVAAAVGWAIFPQFGVTIPFWTIWVGLGLTLVAGFWAAFKANIFSVTTYAILEGAYLGIVSRLFETAYNGIVLQAILITLAVTLGMFFLYSTGIVKVTKKLRSVIIIATVGVFIYLVLELILSLVIPGFLGVVTSGVTGIVIALIIVLIAALNLLLDFDAITKGAENNLSKKAEWYGAFGLLVTLVWLYVSILRLLGASRR